MLLFNPVEIAAVECLPAVKSGCFLKRASAFFLPGYPVRLPTFAAIAACWR
jgi:hypothetical protein